MRISKIYIVITALLLVLGGCDIVDLEERDVIPAEDVLKTIEGLEGMMFQAYEAARTIHENMQVSMYKQCGTDLVKSGTNMGDVAAGGMLGMNQYNAGLSAVSPQIEDIWNDYYRGLARCNQVIEAADLLETDSPSEEETLLRFKGEALAMRAYFYLELVRRWDHIPLSTLLPEGAPPTREAPLQEESVIYNQIISDCEAAIPLLQPRSGTTGVGAPSKGLAYLLLAEAHMDMSNWAEAAEAAENVINDPSYTLQPLDEIFGLNGGKSGEENNREIILSWIFDPAIQGRQHMTAQMYVPLYDRLNGVLRTMEQGGRAWSRLSPSDYYWSLFDPADGRLQAWHYLQWIFDDAENLPPGVNLGDFVTEQDAINQFGEGALQIRYIEPTTTKHWEDGTYGRTTGDAGGYRNIIVYRYAQAFITGAEAHWRNGNEARALELINTLRDRAFGDAMHRFVSLDEETLLEEQARELGHEGHRWAFLKRLGLLVERVQMYNPSAAGNIQPRHVRWPLPQTFTDLTGEAQNEGY